MAFGNRLDDKVAIVAGAGTRGEIAGTGQAASILMAREGAKILLCDVDIDRAEETLNVIEKSHFKNYRSSISNILRTIDMRLRKFRKLNFLKNIVVSMDMIF